METLDLFKALSDEVRLRIVRAVSVAELSVAELVSVLGLPQSTVSRHLKPLRDAELVDPRREGTSVYYRRGKAFQDASLGSLLQGRLEEVRQGPEDLASIRRVMDHRRQRSRNFFDRIAGSYGTLTQPGGGWQALAGALASGFSGLEVADLGAGQGELALWLARFAKRVTAVDLSPQMLKALEANADAAGVSDRITVAEGDIESLPLEDRSVDAAFLSQALHHAAHPPAAIGEAARILRPGGRLIVLELVKHEQEWVREQWADQWLGFEPDELETWMVEAGLSVQLIERIPGSTPELSVLLAVATRTA
jgi:ubiquinone/menaquinone biosynthesis C-methylase UbiE/DNA-binding transcriptional ArsR family regulator